MCTETLQVFRLAKTIFRECDQSCPDMPKVLKITNLLYLRNGWLDYLDLVHVNSPPCMMRPSMAIFNHVLELSYVSCIYVFCIWFVN